MLAAVQGNHTAVAAVDSRRLATVGRIEIYASGTTTGSLLRSKGAALRIPCAVLFNRVLKDIIISRNISRYKDMRTAA